MGESQAVANNFLISAARDQMQSLGLQMEVLDLMQYLIQSDPESTDTEVGADAEYQIYTVGGSIENLTRHSVDAIYIWQFLQSQIGQRLRGPYNLIKKCEDYFEKALGWPERDFRHEFRMSRPMFEKLVDKLEHNPIFISRGKRPQRPVRYQLATFLMRYGARGSDAMAAAKKMGIGFGTVWLYCRRVTRAIRELGATAISWGDQARHDETAAEIQQVSGLPDCIGIIDGSLIRLTEIPAEWGPVYFCRKKYPAVNIQAVCDHEKRFISYDMGWPGSMTDVTILKNSYLWKNRATHFNGNEYILADRGYPSSPYLLRPFTEPEINEHQGQERIRRFQFNKTVSGVRVRIEHSFGMLKGRFLSLKDFGQHDDVQEVYKVIQALMTIHNLCIDWNDSADDFFAQGRAIRPEDDLPDCLDRDPDVLGYGSVDIERDQEFRVASYETDDWHREEGHSKRNSYLDELYPL